MNPKFSSLTNIYVVLRHNVTSYLARWPAQKVTFGKLGKVIRLSDNVANPNVSTEIASNIDSIIVGKPNLNSFNLDSKISMKLMKISFQDNCRVLVDWSSLFL